MILYPAIDLKAGQCVRLMQGRMEDVTVFGTDPAAMAVRWKDAGAKWLHVVDLDGAFAGDAKNLPAIQAIVQAVKLPVQVGGGIRTMAHIQCLLEELGVRRVILGTAALEDPALVRQAVVRYGDRICVGIDARDGRVAVRGWAEDSGVDALAMALHMKDLGIGTVIYTDIARDGMMQGPNFPMTQMMIEKTGMDIILSGGVACMEDVYRANRIGAAGAILGKSIYTGAIDLKAALLEVNPC